MINLVVLFGGMSVEHDISVITYKQVISAIDFKKYNVLSLYLDKGNEFYVLNKLEGLNIEKKNLKKCKFIKKNGCVYCNKFKIDCVLNCVHGKGLEDGTISAFLDLLGVSYTSSSLGSSNVFHNKFYTKLILNKYNINTVDYEYIRFNEWENNQNDVIRRVNRFDEKIIKPVCLGSSVGVKVCNKDNFIEAMDMSFKYDNGIIIERKLKRFLELNQAFYTVNNELIISKIEEVKNNSSVYDFEDKYENNDILRVVPAKLNNQLRSKITKMTKKIGQIFDSKGVVRVDYLYDLDEDVLYVNEVNVIPGALSFYLFEAKNIYFSMLIDDLVKEAIRVNLKENEMIKIFNSNVLEKRKISKFK